LCFLFPPWERKGINQIAVSFFRTPIPFVLSVIPALHATASGTDYKFSAHKASEIQESTDSYVSRHATNDNINEQIFSVRAQTRGLFQLLSKREGRVIVP